MQRDHSSEMVLRRERRQQRAILGVRPLKFRPMGRNKYTGEALRAIRARKVNFLGERQR